MTELELKKTANEVRKNIVTAVYHAHSGHPGGSLSAADILTYLYFEEMNVEPKDPGKADRDRFVLSKGHAAPGLYSALAERGYIDKEELRKNVRKYYQFNNDNRLPSLLFKSQPEYLKSASGDNSKKGRIIRVFESHSPYEFLKAKYKGAKPTDRDMKILESLLIDLKLNPGVVNVLIDYTLKTNNNKLVKFSSKLFVCIKKSLSDDKLFFSIYVVISLYFFEFFSKNKHALYAVT